MGHGPRCRGKVKPGEGARKATAGRQVADLMCTSVRGLGELDGRINLAFAPVRINRRIDVRE